MNNILHLKYAVEIEKTGSITKAAENLYMGQPNLSRAIRELEESLGITIFMRSSRGVVPTEQGREFLNYARNILAQVEEMENLYGKTGANRQRFAISVPRASYVAFAFTEFLKELDFNRDVSVNYRETNSMHAIKNVAESVNNMAIVRYQTDYEAYYLKYLRDRGLDFTPLWEFDYLALMSREHPLAPREDITAADLEPYTEIIHGDVSVPALPMAEARELAVINESKKCITIYERGSQFELLCRLPSSFMWVSPMPEEVLQRFGLVQKQCRVEGIRFRDVLIFRQDYSLNRKEKLFLEKLQETIEAVRVEPRA